MGSRRITTAFRIDLPNWTTGGGTSAALAPDGTHVAIADGHTVAILGLAEQKIVQRGPREGDRPRVLAGREALEAQLAIGELGTADSSVAIEISRTTSTMSRFAFQTRS